MRLRGRGCRRLRRGPDRSANPATIQKFYDLPDKTEAPRIIRTFKFDRLNGQWSINGQFFAYVAEPGAKTMIVREVFNDWDTEERGTIWIENPSAMGVPAAPLSEDRLRQRYEVAAKLRDQLANTIDVDTLDQWLDRSARYDVALRALYAALEDSDGRITGAELSNVRPLSGSPLGKYVAPTAVARSTTISRIGGGSTRAPGSQSAATAVSWSSSTRAFSRSIPRSRSASSRRRRRTFSSTSS